LRIIFSGGLEPMKKKDSTYVLIWAKKLRAVNLLGGKCSKCDEVRLPALEFHHHDDNKEENVGNFRTLRWSKFWSEARRCEVLCRNCHGEVHNYRCNILKERVLDLKGERVCCVCGYGRCTASLDFHHIDWRKDFRLSRCYRGDRWNMPVESILSELDKCVILCRNCHSMKHYDADRLKLFWDTIEIKANSMLELKPKIDRRVLHTMFADNGMSQKQICDKLGCAKSTVSLALKQMGL
jgi:predicted XRE-type DNA-binding protein